MVLDLLQLQYYARFTTISSWNSILIANKTRELEFRVRFILKEMSRRGPNKKSHTVELLMKKINDWTL